MERGPVDVDVKNICVFGFGKNVVKGAGKIVVGGFRQLCMVIVGDFTNQKVGFAIKERFDSFHVDRVNRLKFDVFDDVE